MHCVVLGDSFPTSIYLQNLASIQPKTDRLKFGGMGYGPTPHQGSTSAISIAQVASADGGNQSLVQSLFSIDPDAGIGVMSRLLACFLQNESHFAGLIGGDETQLIAKFVGETTDLFSKVVAHNSLPDSVATVAAMLRTLRSRMRELDGSAGPAVQIPNSHGNLGIGIGIFARPNSQIPVQIPNSQRLALGCIEAKFCN